MIDHLIEFARQHHCKNFLYFSSWVVHFPERVFSAEYIKMKRHCEQRLRESGLPNVCILRPSVVLGDGLSWTRILSRIAPFGNWIPKRVTRSFTSIEEVCGQVVRLIDGDSTSTTITVLGKRRPLGEQAIASVQNTTDQTRPFRFLDPVYVRILIAGVLSISLTAAWWSSSAILLACALALVGLLGITFLPRVVATTASWVSDYFAGFAVRTFQPESERDLLSLAQECNTDIRIRGYDNQGLYFLNPGGLRSTTVSLRKLDQVIELDTNRNVVHVQAGIHFGTLLRFLESHGKWLANYPNYHFISVGACIATPVHGSNLAFPFIADLVESVRVYDRNRDRVLSVGPNDELFHRLIFSPETLRGSVILSAELRITDRQKYVLNSRSVPVENLKFDFTDGRILGQSNDVNQESCQHSEVRINAPSSSHATIQSYRQVSDPSECEKRGDNELLSIKADSIGRKWNLLQSNAVTSACTSSIARGFLNFEWFFSPEDFETFWKALHVGKSRPGFYKLLIRYNRVNQHLSTPFHGTISIDITVLNHPWARRRGVELYQQFRPLEHRGKYSIERYLRRTS